MTKRSSLFAGAILICIAVVFASAITLLVLPGVHMLPGYRLGAEDMLPAQQTVFLLSHPSTQDLQRWKTVFPALDDVISDNPLDAVAVLAIGDKKMMSVGFRKKSGAWDGKSCDIGPWQMVFGEQQLSCPGIHALDTFLAPGPRLSEDRGWNALGRHPKQSWAFIRREALPSGEILSQRIAQELLFGNATHLLAFSEQGNTVLRSWPAPPLSPLSEASLSTPLEDLQAVLSFGNLEELFATLERDLPVSDGNVLEGLLLQKLEDFSGPRVSLRHELLPLLALDAEIHMGRTASGTEALLLTGNAQKTTDTASQIDAMHRSFALRHPDVELLEYAFEDGRFPFQTLRLSKDASREEREQIRGWAVRISRDPADGAMLITARNERQTAISNDPELIGRFLMEEGTAIAVPMAKRPLISRMAAAMVVPNAWLEHVPFWMTEEGESVVSVEQSGEMRIVRLREWRMEN